MKRWQPLAVLALGGIVGYFAAKSDGMTPRSAEAEERHASATAPPEVDGAAPCCKEDLRGELLLAQVDGDILAQAQSTRRRQPAASGKQPNIVIIWGDDIGQSNVSAYTMGLMGYRTPNIDRVAHEGMIFTDYYAEQSCTAGRASFLTGQHGLRTGMTKVGLPAATLGLQKDDPTIAELLKPLGYATGQFGKNHLGDRNEFLPTVHGFDEFYGNLFHLNAEEEP